MDKILLTKVKFILSECTPDNVNRIKKQLMVTLKPEQAEEVYEYFLRIEPDYVLENCKVHVNQVIPLYTDYFKKDIKVADFIFDEFDIDGYENSK
jgi:hypothetical protein